MHTWADVMILELMWSARYPLSSRISEQGQQKIYLMLNYFIPVKPQYLEISNEQLCKTSNRMYEVCHFLTYLTLSQREQLEHPVQIDEVPASTEKNWKAKNLSYKQFILTQQTKEGSLLMIGIECCNVSFSVVSKIIDNSTLAVLTQ